MGIRSPKPIFNIQFLAALFLLALLIAAVYLTANDRATVFQETDAKTDIGAAPENNSTAQIGGINGYNSSSTGTATGQKTNVLEDDGSVDRNSTVGSCDLSSGRWVYDNLTMPSYRGDQCSFMMEDFACEKYGRTDLKYQEWRWQPRDCDLPRFNGTAFLEKIRGKKLIFVGDSLNRNQHTSMLCLIESSLPQSADKSVIRHGNMFLFQATEYNATIGFYWSPFLVESNNDDPYVHRVHDRVIRVKGIANHARHWTDADILVFDSFMWWLEPNMTILWGSFGSDEAINKTVDRRHRIFEMGLNTWSDWLEFNINRTKTKVFFMSQAPFHRLGESWGGKQNCYNETEPILKEEYWGATTDWEMMRIVESVIKKLDTRGVKVEYLDITRLSDYRKDGHPSVYRKFFRPLSEEDLRDPANYSDCGHWCLPGVPDTWNEILYAHIMSS